MRVYYIGSYDGCYYVRCLVPLQANGWKGYKQTLGSEKDSQQKMIAHCHEADVIVFQRPLLASHVELAKVLKTMGKKIVMDNDDTYIKDSGVPKQILSVKVGTQKITNKVVDERLQKVDDNLKKFAELADMVTVSTHFLAEEYRKVSDNVVVLPNCIQPDDWPKPERNKTKKVRIGISGSVASNKDYTHIIPALDELKNRDDVQLVLFALPPDTPEYKIQRKIYKNEIAFWNGYNVEWQPQVSIDRYMDTLASLKLDIMLIPRFDSYFNRCKSNLKFLEASILEIPVIAQGFSDNLSPYQDPQDAKHMIVVKDNRKWLKLIEILIEDKKLRQIIGKKARKYVVKRYNINTNASLYEEAYKTLWNEK